MADARQAARQLGRALLVLDIDAVIRPDLNVITCHLSPDAAAAVARVLDKHRSARQTLLTACDGRSAVDGIAP